jgi:F-type H+-transporting ATPase subunit delta
MTKTKSLNVYGEAYVDALPEQVNGVSELKLAHDLLKNAPSIVSYLLDRSMDTQDKLGALKIALPDTSDETHNFLLLLADERAIKRIDRILELVKEIYAEREDRMFVRVTSAIELTDDEVSRIGNALKNKLNKPVLIETNIDESIYGGIAVRIGDWVFDSSIRGRIERLKNTLTV